MHLLLDGRGSVHAVLLRAWLRRLRPQDIPDIPPMPVAEEKTGVMAVLALITQVAACLAMLALTWMLFENFSGK